MRLSIFIVISLGFFSDVWSQQHWEYEFHSNEEKLYRKVLAANNVKSIKTFFAHNNGTPSIPREVIELDKNGNVLSVVKKANLYTKIKTDVLIEENTYDAYGNLMTSLILNEKPGDTSKFAVYQYDSLNNLVAETRKEEHYIERAGSGWDKLYRNVTCSYENEYDPSNRLILQIKQSSLGTWLKTEFKYDEAGNLIEIKKYRKDSQCLDRWIKFSYSDDHYLKDKFYPSFNCGLHSTVNDNLYTYKYNAKKQLEAVEHTNEGSDRGKMIYTYNNAGLLIFMQPDKDFGEVRIGLEYEFYE